MHIVIALDSFKGSLSAKEACLAVRIGFLKAIPNATCSLIPISDGGEGFIEALESALEPLGFVREQVEIKKGPSVKNTIIPYLRQGTSYIVESAKAIGLEFYKKEELDPFSASTYPLGLTLRELIKKGAQDITLGLGGSATSDLGAGMLQALGVKFYDEKHHLIEVFCPNDFLKVFDVDFSEFETLISKLKIKLCMDVKNPLFGPHGAVYTFAPQKGCKKEDLPRLEKYLEHFYEVIVKNHNDIKELKGSGAAGGLGAIFPLAFNEVTTQSGLEYVVEKTKTHDLIAKCDLLVVGEGSLDEQSAQGKAPQGLALIAKQYKKPVIALAGKVELNAQSLYQSGITSMFAIANGPLSLDESISQSALLLEHTAFNLGKLLKAFKG